MRCRNVKDPRIDILNDKMLKINNNNNFWRFSEVMELNRQSVQKTAMEFLIDGDHLELLNNQRNKRHKTISVYNTAENLNKHPSLFINYLRVLAAGKGMEFRVDGKDEKDEDEKQKKTAQEL